MPCPTALVVLLAAISLHRVGYGLVLIVAFSLGLAATITAIGLVAVTAKRVFARLRLDGPALRAIPAISALVVLALGVAMTAARASRRPLRRRSCSDSTTPSRRSPTRRASRSCSWSRCLGLRHATDPDHLAAVTTLVASSGSRPPAGPRGSAWRGEGARADALRVRLAPSSRHDCCRRSSRARRPRSASSSSASRSGCSCAGAAVSSTCTSTRTTGAHGHVHGHAAGLRHCTRTAGARSRRVRGRSPARRGSAGVGVLLVATIDSRGYAVAALAVLAVFTAVSMTALTTGFGLGLGSRPAARAYGRVAPPSERSASHSASGTRWERWSSRRTCSDRLVSSGAMAVAPDPVADLTRDATNVLPEGEPRAQARAQPAAPRQARHRPDRAGHPPGFAVVLRKRAFQDAGHIARAHRRRLHGPDRRPVRPVEGAAGTPRRGARPQRAALRGAGVSHPRSRPNGSTASGRSSTTPARPPDANGNRGAPARARRLREALRRARAHLDLRLLYPFAQGYDSVAVEADVEVGEATSSTTSWAVT